MTYIHPLRIYLCENGVRLGQVKECIATFDWFHLDVMKACNSLKRFEDIFHSYSETGPGPFNVDAKNLKVGKKGNTEAPYRAT